MQVWPETAAPRPPEPPEEEPLAPLSGGRRDTIAMQVYRTLRQRIVTGRFLPAQALSESEIAGALGVSRTPVREALGKLEEEALVCILPQVGTFVSSIRLDVLSSSQFVREALECAAVGEAARRCTEADARRLDAMLEQQRDSAEEAAFFAADDAMHHALMTLAGQEGAWRVVDAAKATIDRVRFLAVRHDLKRQAVLAEHARILDAVGGHAPGRAEAAMRGHLRGVFESTKRTMAMHPEYFGPQAEGERPRRARRPA